MAKGMILGDAVVAAMKKRQVVIETTDGYEVIPDGLVFDDEPGMRVLYDFSLNDPYEYLMDHGEKIDSAPEGTCFLYEMDQEEYVVLADNSIITRAEDNNGLGDDPIFPY